MEEQKNLSTSTAADRREANWSHRPKRRQRESSRTSTFFVCGAALALLLTLVGLVLHYLSATRATPQEAINAGRVLVTKHLGGSVDLHFPSNDWIHVERSGESFLVSGWVEAVSRDTAASVTYNFSCTLRLDADSDWVATKVDLIPLPG